MDHARHGNTAQATSAGVPPVTSTSSSNVVGNTERATPPAAQTRSNSPSATSTRVRTGAGCPTGGDPADDLPGGLAHELLRRPSDPLRADQGRDPVGVHPVRAGGEDEQRGAVGVEDQRVRDLADLDLQRGGRRGGGGHRVGQQHQARDRRGIGTGPAQRLLHGGDAGMVGGVFDARAHPGHPARTAPRPLPGSSEVPRRNLRGRRGPATRRRPRPAPRPRPAGSSGCGRGPRPGTGAGHRVRTARRPGRGSGGRPGRRR